jgi:hypothetical protein
MQYGVLDRIARSEAPMFGLTAGESVVPAAGSSAVQPVEWARRLSFVADSRATGAQPIRALRFRRKDCSLTGPARARPYLYSAEEIRRLLQTALELASLQGLAGKTYTVCWAVIRNRSAHQRGSPLAIRRRGFDGGHSCGSKYEV